MATSNIINAVFGSGLCAVTTSAYRANYGMVLRFSGLDLPTAFEVDFSNYDVMGRDSITMIGQNGEVQIPDQLWDSGLNIYAYVYLHPTDDSGVTVYTVTIPVLGRPNRTEETPTPHEQSVIEQAISALNDAVEQTAADVASADASAQAAAQSEANASVSERAAAASASAALASQNAAESAAQSATESASGASESARNAAVSASQAAESATSAQESAEQAERSVQSITDDVERAERAAQAATNKATEAASSASSAASSASSAASAAQNAAESEQLAESSATDAEQAKTAAQDAQAAAEQAAESVSGLSAQIEQNTADIADLVQSKAGVLIDTASGSIASFMPDSTIPTVKGLTVEVEPVQEGSGDPSPDNIRPISGWDAVEVKHSGADMTNPTTYTIQLGQTVYGCKIYATQGKMVVDRWYLTKANASKIKYYFTATQPRVEMIFDSGKRANADSQENGFSSMYQTTTGVQDKRMRLYGTEIDIYDTNFTDQAATDAILADFIAVYKLNTPITIDLTPLEISVLTGQTNNIWADSGDVSVEYAADLKTYIDNKIAAAVAALS